MSYSTGRRWRCPPDVRRRVLKAYEGCCYLCSLPATQVDHKVPWSLGGSDEDWNLAPVCATCHAIKSENERREGFARKMALRSPKEDPHP